MTTIVVLTLLQLPPSPPSPPIDELAALHTQQMARMVLLIQHEESLEQQLTNTRRSIRMLDRRATPTMHELVEQLWRANGEWPVRYGDWFYQVRLVDGQKLLRVWPVEPPMYREDFE